MIAALVKAHSLAQFARNQGAPLETFFLTLTEPEAYELLDYLAAGGLGRYQHHDLLIVDVAKAKADRDPFPLLGHFQLQGLHIWPASALH